MRLAEKVEVIFFKLDWVRFSLRPDFVRPAVSEIQLFKGWVFFPRSEFFLFISLFFVEYRQEYSHERSQGQ
jgi:hypothetical protein